MLLREKIDMSLGISVKNKTDELKRQRTTEKYNFQKRYRFDIIWDVYKKRLLASFGNRCFKCGIRDELVIDHHIPLALGGHTVEGNLVSLCKRCNNKKLDQPPEYYYTRQELDILMKILSRQADLLHFRFDFGAWESDPAKYLIDIGINPNIVFEFMKKLNHKSMPSEEVI